MLNSSKLSISVIGAGIVGLATAMKLRIQFPRAKIVVWEKEVNAGMHQSTHNSGVLHAGLYYKPGSLKARMAVEGIREMTAFCRDNGVPHEICGKVVVAVTDEETVRLRALHERGTANHLAGLRWLTKEELIEREPLANGLAALLVPEEGIVDYAAVINAMKQRLEEGGVEIRLGHKVEKLEWNGMNWDISSRTQKETSDFLVNCAGLYCDRIAVLAGEKPSSKIIPFRGEYFQLKPSVAQRLNGLIYPVPDPTFPFLGVHFTRMIHGGAEAGPNAVLAFAREGYRGWHLNVRDLADCLGFPGLWRFIARHSAMCFHEMACSASRTLFCRALQRLVPSITENDLLPGLAGVRAQAMNESGELVQDFHFIERPNSLHVLNAPSPGATASLAIGGHIASKVASILTS